MDEARERLERFYQKWQKEELAVVKHFQVQVRNLMHYYRYPPCYLHRLRTKNMAEELFSRLENFLRRFHGWVDKSYRIYHRCSSVI